MSAADHSTSKPVPKGPPQGMVKQLHSTIAAELGIERVADPKCSQAFSDILNDALADKLPSGVTVAPSDTQFISKPKLLAAHLMTARKKPVAAFFVPDEDPASDKGVLALVVRGSNKQTHPRFIKIDDNQLCSAITYMVHTTLPDSAANFHPWFSSLVLNFVDHYGADLNAVKLATATPALVDSRVAIIVMPPLDKKLESILHKLAIDIAPDKVNAKELEDHFLKWTQTAMSDGFPRREERLACLKSIVSARAAQEDAIMEDECEHDQPVSTAPAPAAKLATKSALKKRPTVVDDDEEDEETTKPVVKKAKQSGGQRFVSSSMEASSKEDEREARNTAAFQAKVQRDYADSEAEEEDKENNDDGDSDSGSNHKKSKSKKNKHSNSESELSDGDDESEDDDESDDDNSDEESDDDLTSESNESSSESDEEPKAKKAKKGRLVKTADKLRQTTLVLSKAVESDATPAEASEPAPAAAKKDSRAPACDRRAHVASQCHLMLNSVEACVGVPLGQTAHVQKLVADLREAYKLYGSSDGGKVSDSYTIHTMQAELTSALVAALNATLTEGQRSEEAAASRRIAVSSTKAMVSVVPFLEALKAKVDQFISIDAKRIEEDLAQSAACIPAEQA